MSPAFRNLGWAVAWGLLAVAIALGLAAELSSPSLYDLVPCYDEALHAFFTLSLTLVLAHLLYSACLTGAHEHPLLLLLALTLIALGAGAIWELGEWLYDLALPGQQIQGKRDTMLDLACDLGGGLAGAGIALWYLRRGARP